MPKGKRKGKGRGVSMNTNTKVPFKFVTTFNASASGFTSSNLDLIPFNMGGRLTTFVTDFKKWRLLKLRIKGFVDGVPTIGSASGNAGVTLVSGYLGTALSNVATNPSSVAEIATFMYADLGNSHVKYSVPRSTLHEAANSDWLLTSAAGSVPTVDNSAGSVWSALQLGQALAVGSARAYIIYSGVAEFCEPTTPSVSLTGGVGRLTLHPTIPDRTLVSLDDLVSDASEASESSWADEKGDPPDLSKEQVALLFKKFVVFMGKSVKAKAKPSAEDAQDARERSESGLGRSSVGI